MGSNPIGGFFARHVEDGAITSNATQILDCSHGFSLLALLTPVFFWIGPRSQQVVTPMLVVALEALWETHGHLKGGAMS